MSGVDVIGVQELADALAGAGGFTDRDRLVGRVRDAVAQAGRPGDDEAAVRVREAQDRVLAALEDWLFCFRWQKPRNPQSWAARLVAEFAALRRERDLPEVSLPTPRVVRVARQFDANDPLDLSTPVQLPS